MSRTRALAAALLALTMTLPPASARRAAAQEPAQVRTPAPPDPYVWLEDVEGARSMEWVKAHNEVTTKALTADPLYQTLYDRILAVLTARDRIAMPRIMGERIYNFWQDAQHPRGIWRSADFDSYVGGTPAWRTLLDVDSLAKAENVAWSWRGASCLPPEYRRCLMSLSRGGADAVQVREFDLGAPGFVAGGFTLPEAKQSVAWLNADAVLVATDFGPGSMTTSGYARIAKLWKRGTPLSEARTLMEVKPTDMEVTVGSEETKDGLLGIVRHMPAFFQSETYVLRGDSLVKLELPIDADPTIVGDQLAVYLRSPWQVGGQSFPAGSLVATTYAGFLGGGRDFHLVLSPAARQTIVNVEATRDYLLVSMLDDVRPELLRFRPSSSGWTSDTIPVPGYGTARVAATSPTTNRFFFTFAGFTQPTTLYLSGEDGKVSEVKRLPPKFAAADLVTDRYDATSKDGTRVPYFVVHRKEMKLDGRNPTLQYGYGGFEIAMLPDYSSTEGVAWLERGGVYVLADIRGGGEFGPTWHRSAMRENRQRAYDDFIAVAEDVIRRKITSPAHLGIMGGSNGGLLMGNMFTQRPDLWNAVVIRNPLLDMFRYSHLLAGASWMAEYGNPDVPSDWAFLQRYSAYQNLKQGVKYPRPFIATTTRDDRVHPGHARKFAAKLEGFGDPFYFFENTEGGHGAGVTSAQRAR
ncbi:MAG TPA: prolyl oligopeptidase family serine peptidase, partial [Longimicrobiales bacterium]